MKRSKKKKAAKERAVAAAAKKIIDDGKILTIHHEYDSISLSKGQPDITIHLDVDESTGKYRYQMSGSAAQMSLRNSGKLPGTSNAGLLLRTLRAALKSILQKNINGCVCDRYNFPTRTAAIASRKRPIVLILTTDKSLIELGRKITSGAAESDVLPFVPPAEERAAWKAVARQLHRFVIRWDSILNNQPALESLRLWADALEAGVTHNGPILSSSVAA